MPSHFEAAYSLLYNIKLKFISNQRPKIGLEHTFIPYKSKTLAK